MMTTENSQISKTYRIHESRIFELQERISKLNKKAEKLGCKPITLTTVDTENQKGADGSIIRYFKVKVDGERPVLNGWSFIATIQHLSEVGNVIRVVVGETLPEVYRNTDNTQCDHCQVKRYRKDTYVLRSEANGEHKQVGSTCLEDFLGTTNINGLETYTKMLSSLNDLVTSFEVEAERGEAGAGWKPHLFSLDKFLHFAAMAYRIYGWVSRAEARDQDKIATANRAWTLMTGFTLSEKLQPTDEDRQTVEKALEWAEQLATKENLTDYEHNLNVIVQTGAMDERCVGIAASLIHVYKRSTGRREGFENSKHVGTIGEVVELTLTVRDQGYGPYGILYTFADDKNNKLVWFTNRTHDELQPGNTVKVTAQIKKHDTYKGTESTVITKVKLPKAKKGKK